MSQMSTQPVFACRVCRKPVVVAHLSTREDDPDGQKLIALMNALRSIALCPYHQSMRDWYAAQGRLKEFEDNYLNPRVVLYNVNDETGVDWYGRHQS